MPLCGSSTCGCAIVSVPATTGAINGDLPTIDVAGNGTAASPWNLTLNDNWADAIPKGIVSNVVNITTVSAGIGAATWTAIAGSGIWFTALAGRRYRVTWAGVLNSNHGATTYAYIGLWNSAGPTRLQSAGGVIAANSTDGDELAVCGSYTGTFTPGAITLDLRAIFGAGAGNTVTGSAQTPLQGWVEDIGPA